MVRLHTTLGEQQVPARIVLQVHDELLLEVRAEALMAAAAIVKREMEGVAKLKVPLVIEAKAGPNWAELARL
jgi:DNA polymerase-1